MSSPPLNLLILLLLSNLLAYFHSISALQLVVDHTIHKSTGHEDSTPSLGFDGFENVMLHALWEKLLRCTQHVEKSNNE